MLYNISYIYKDSKRNEYVNEKHFKDDIECFKYANDTKFQKGANALRVCKKTNYGWEIILIEQLNKN